MRVSYNWLNEFVDLKESPEALADMLTMLGLEAEVASNFDDINGKSKSEEWKAPV